MTTSSDGASPGLALWGGIECTRNRVQDWYIDQVELAGHDRRADDLQRIADLGIRVLRYPVLWEWAAQSTPGNFDWCWADERLPLLRQLGITPIAGLVHHGSGPLDTSLVDDSFAPRLAHYAAALAQRFPWLTHFTPVNEPLTTARFSALYGHWYPHARDDIAFARAMLNQVRGVVLAMEEIRKVTPEAKLVQTEDLGTTYSTPTLEYQADFDNARRWLTFDLLCGKVDRHHPIGSFFLWLGLDEDELHWFADHPTPPDVVGINHYVTSDRYLDQRVRRYPHLCPGTNGIHTYIDTEAVRALRRYKTGIAELLQQVWERYHLPVAITEAHLCCGREDQLRWLWQVWQGAQAARAAGADVRAVTVWSLLGAFDWDSLVTQSRGHYEPGVFDIRAPEPRPTALAPLVRDLATGREPRSPLLDQPGWWQRRRRLWGADDDRMEELGGQPLVITGGRGTLAHAFARVCVARAIPFRLLPREELDIADPHSVAAAIEAYEPWGIVNTAGYVRVDDAQRERRQCRRENVRGPMVLARECARRGLPLVSFSSDLVFGGDQQHPYREGDRTAPLNFYGKSKVAAERYLLAIHPETLVIRTSAFFGPWDEHNFVFHVASALAAGREVATADVVVSPTYVPDLVHTTLDLLLDGARGIWHIANGGECSWTELARAVAKHASLDHDLIKPCSPLHMGWSAPRPHYSALTSANGVALRGWDSALGCYFVDSARALRESDRASKRGGPFNSGTISANKTPSLLSI